MSELDIKAWVQEIHQAIQETEALIGPLRHLGKHEWAAQLTEEAKIMREVIDALERIGQSKSKRLGRPPKWLQPLTEAQGPKTKRGQRKRGEPEGGL